MKRILPLLLLLACLGDLKAQITTPTVQAFFGVDGELRSYYRDTWMWASDDWFTQPSTSGTGNFVIDTTGAAAIVSQYATDPNFRKIPFYRTMAVPSYSVINNKLWIDAVMIRDYHGTDSTIFASGASKNGQSPADWSCPVAQSIPDKNDILDMFVHVRRDGPTSTSPLWMFGGLSIENTTGDRYFDFEMYQTDIYYDRASQKFYGYGPDAGHTRWQFDASGNVTVPGDIIFSADYGSSTLSSIEARIWVDSSALSLTPTAFDWSGTFDGATNGSQYGYAGIKPKTAGNFYMGLESKNSTWAGPYSLVREDNSVVTTYLAGQFMEFGVNLTLLGLDPVTLLGSDACGMPFRRVLVKSRASTSFTSALKDFVGPFDFFLAPRAEAAANIPVFCGSMGVSDISVTNATSTSSYTWATSDGHIVGADTGTVISVDLPGTYVVTQRLQAGCSVYATDTVQVIYDASCTVLDDGILDFRGNLKNQLATINWTVSSNEGIQYFNLQRSTDGTHFRQVSKTYRSNSTSYSTTDDVQDVSQPYLFYRLQLVHQNGEVTYSKVIKMAQDGGGKSMISILPNPASTMTQLNITSSSESTMRLNVYDFTGRLMRSNLVHIQKGNSIVTIDGLGQWPGGIYTVKAVLNNEVFTDRIVLVK